MATTITLILDDIRHLFNTPEFDPFSTHPRDISGIDSIMQELQPLRTIDALHTTIYLPPEQITAELPEQVRTAVTRYAEQKIQATSMELKILRWRGWRGLRVGMLFLGGCLLLGTAAEQAAFLPAWLSSFLYNGFNIIGWVSLWHPAEAILFDWYEPWRDRRLYRHIASMHLEIKPALS